MCYFVAVKFYNMKNRWTCFALLLLFAGTTYRQAMAQKKKSREQEVIQIPEFPLDEGTGLITYSEVVQVSGTAAELYKKGLKWFNTFYKNPSAVIKSRDEAQAKISGKPKFRIYIDDPNAGVRSNAGTVMYNITLQCKDGRYKYDISKLIWVRSSPFPVEKWIAENKKKYNYAYANYLVQTDQYMKDLIAKLKQHMAATEKPKPADW